MSQSKQLTQTALFFALLSALTAVLLIVTVTPSHAAVGDLTFTIEGPAVQSSQVSCSNNFITEDFDSTSTGLYTNIPSSLGTYEQGSSVILIDPADDFGGAGGTGNYINTNGDKSYTLTLDTTQYPNGAGYFGFWWSAGNGNNRVKVNMADGTSQTFSTQTILDSGSLVGTPGTAAGHYGNPNNGANADEVYAYVNIFADNDNARIVSLEFSEITGSVGFFESDNHSACADLLNPDTGSPIPQIGSITVVKEANPESEQEFSFLTSIGGPGSEFTLKDNGVDPNSITFNDLPPSVYNVDEFTVPSGWTFTSLECTGGADIVIGGKNANIYLSGGENVTCTYTNSKNGTIIIQKEVRPANATTYGFTDNIEAPNSFTLGNTGQQVFEDVPPGSYTVTEDANSGAFQLRDMRCIDSDSDGTRSTVSVETRTATINLDADETVTCTFLNSNSPTAVQLVDFGAGTGPSPFAAGLSGLWVYVLAAVLLLGSVTALSGAVMVLRRR